MKHPRVESAARLIVGAFCRGPYRLQVEGRDALPVDGPAVVVANHRSYIDPFVLGYALGRTPRFVTTVRVFRNPLTRWFCERMEAIPARRGGADPRAVREVLRTLDAGRVVAIFPEGERSWDGRPLPYMRGALRLLSRLEVPIVPASLVGTYEAWPRWAPQPRLSRLRVVFGAPIHPAGVPLEELRRRLNDAMHGPVAEAGPVHARAFGLARGLSRLLWWCPCCGEVGGLREASGERLECGSCGAPYQLDERYRLSGPDPASGAVARGPLSAWAGSGPPALRPLEPSRAEVLWLKRDERLYLRAPATLLVGRWPEIERLGEGQVALTERRIHFVGAGKEQSLPTRSLTTIVIEGPEVLQLGDRDRMWRLWLPGDSTLKWEVYLRALEDSHRGAAGQAGGVRARAGS